MSNKGPLNGITILDLSRLLPGPLASQLMADMGARVIKIEDKNHPDLTRFYPPLKEDESIYFASLNRNKESLCIDLKSKEGKSLFLKLIPKVDVVLESFRAGVIDKMGVGYEQAKAKNEKIIYVSLTGYGQTGKFCKKAGHDVNYMGYSGLQSLTGHKESGPHLSGGQIADIAGGAYPAVIATLAAILSRNSLGIGQQVDVAMTDCLMPLLTMPLAEQLNAADDNIGLGEYFLGGQLAHYNIYECKDGKYIALGSLEPKFWMNFCLMINKEEWGNRMIPNSENVHSLKEDLTNLFKEKPQDEWLRLAENHDACLTPILSLEEACNHEYHDERNNFLSVPIGSTSKIKAVNQPIKFLNFNYNTPALPPPQLGEHSVEILKDLDFSQDEILNFKNQGVIL